MPAPKHVAAAVGAWLTRRRVAALLMAAAVPAATVGAWLQWSAGVALLVAAGLLVSLALILGWE